MQYASLFEFGRREGGSVKGREGERERTYAFLRDPPSRLRRTLLDIQTEKLVITVINTYLALSVLQALPLAFPHTLFHQL